MLASLLGFVPAVAALRIVVTPMPDGSIERTLLIDADDGVRAIVRRSLVNSDVIRSTDRVIRRGRYTWRIDEEKRVILMAPPGKPTGVKARAFVVSGWIDTSQRSTDAPIPTESFRFYAPTREEALKLRDRLRRMLKP